MHCYHLREKAQEMLEDQLGTQLDKGPATGQQKLDAKESRHKINLKSLNILLIDNLDFTTQDKPRQTQLNKSSL